MDNPFVTIFLAIVIVGGCMSVVALPIVWLAKYGSDEIAGETLKSIWHWIRGKFQ